MDKLGPNSANASPLTPLGFLERAATVYGDLTSVIYNSTTYTWSQTYRRCLRLASALSSLGVSPGDVVSVLAPNTPAMYEMHFGVPMSGAVLNTINIRLDVRRWSCLAPATGGGVAQGPCSSILSSGPLVATDRSSLSPRSSTRSEIDSRSERHPAKISSYCRGRPVRRTRRLIETGRSGVPGWVRPT
ncbi:uncharacterized protein A4U43_UnF1790 [Asparagus officinalis]|uniref:AMP-dependent synthetase/ligase domain-containing protein n=1 Tax=Asparagus officinalis TaxID=4686 RepID=A0A1R3L7G6_ASPOF|nr:uncharacterized protein A4U43_UnF1790 [Asparagus officinalis]